MCIWIDTQSTCEKNVSSWKNKKSYGITVFIFFFRPQMIQQEIPKISVSDFIKLVFMLIFQKKHS